MVSKRRVIARTHTASYYCTRQSQQQRKTKAHNTTTKTILVKTRSQRFPEDFSAMKLYAAILSLACLASQAAAFSAVAPNTPAKAAAAANGGGPSTEPIDRTMKGIDAQGSFDPTSGENPALKRNNKDEVWVDQVSYSICAWVEFTLDPAKQIGRVDLLNFKK